METLGKLFGSSDKVKIMRLFLRHPGQSLSVKEIGERSRIRPPTAGRELKSLSDLGFLETKKRGVVRVWQLDLSFPFLLPLKTILKNDLLSRKRELVKQFGRAGRVALLVIAGVFLEDTERRTDLLVVGNNLKKNLIGRIVKDLEAEVGKELNYAVLETADFQYRLNAYDKFVRDLLDYPHSVIIDKIGLAQAPYFLAGLSTVR